MEIKTGYPLLGERTSYIKMSYNKGLKHFKDLGVMKTVLIKCIYEREKTGYISTI